MVRWNGRKRGWERGEGISEEIKEGAVRFVRICVRNGGLATRCQSESV